MKAKLVENIDFKRGLGTKGSLKIGGFVPEELNDEIFNAAYDEWKASLEQLIGKKIKFRGATFQGRHTWKDHEITVKKITCDNGSEFSVMDTDDAWYTVLSDARIYID